MIVALGTLHRQSQHGRAEYLDFVADYVDPVLQKVHIQHTCRVFGQAQEASGHQVVDHFLSEHRSVLVIRQLIACNLLQ